MIPRLVRSLVVVPLISMACMAQGVRLYPVDDTARDPGFRSFVKKLRAAVDKHDTAALRKLVDDEVVVGASPSDKGWDRFLARWHPDERENQAVWDALADMLALGFIQEHPGLFLSPYLVWRFPQDVDPVTHLVVVQDKVPLREAPAPRAESSATLSFEIVERLEQVQQGETLGQWIRVRTLDGKTGYVEGRAVRSPLMPRAQFAMKRGHWRLVALEGAEPQK